MHYTLLLHTIEPFAQTTHSSNRRDLLNILRVRSILLASRLDMAHIRGPQHLCAFVDVVLATEEGVHLLEGDLLGLGDEKVDEGRQENVGGEEEEQALEPLVG